MEPSTWKAFCQAILTMTGRPIAEIPPDRIERLFKCTLCGMEFKTAMKLDEVKHKALMVNCGGLWRALEPAREQAVGQSAVHGSAAP